MVRLPARQVASNHKHPRQEAYLCVDEGVELHWQDAKGHVHAEQMAGGARLTLFVIASFVPHAVVNTSGRDVTLLGYADGPLEGAQPATVAPVP